jgi:hypothetical protein
MTWVYIQERKKDDLLDHIFLNTYHNIISLEKDQKFCKFWKNNIKVGPTTHDSNDHSRPFKRHRIVFFKKFRIQKTPKIL